MAVEKMAVCCARRQSAVTMQEANLARLAQKTSLRAAKGLEIETFKAKLEECKGHVADAKQALVDHEAEHAGTPR